MILEHVAQGVVALSYSVICVGFIYSAVYTTSYTRSVIRRLGAVSSGAWALLYWYRTLFGHPPVWVSRISHGLLIGFFSYMLWLMHSFDKVNR